MIFLDKEGVAHLWKHIVAKLNLKVETEDGKGLSTNDFTNEEKEKLANMESFVETKVAALVDSAPETLNTLNELSAALGDDPNFATTVATQIGGKVDKEEGKGLSSNDFTAEEKEKLAAAVLSVNGVEPDENGNIESYHSVSFNFVDGSAIIPGLITYYGTETMTELCNYYTQSGTYNVECRRMIMANGSSMRSCNCIGNEAIKDADGNVIG